MINEATLQARIDKVLKNMFPTFKEVKVEHQKSFSIKFGHHNVSVDLKSPSHYSTRAILDILLTIEGKNIILLELKKEGLKLTEDDIKQGISYARLIPQMPPITLISNGEDNEMYNTYSREKLNEAEVDVALLKKITNSSFELALNDFKESVDVLLNKDNILFSKIINQISQSKFDEISGEIFDFSRPICSEFQIKRESLNEIDDFFKGGASLVGVVGHSFSGKTNLLYQFFKKTQSNDSFLLYIDCYEHNYSIFQQLANYFTRNAKILISKDNIREWLINSLSNNPNAKFYLLIDNFNNEIPDEIKNEIIELIDIFSGISQHTLYTTDELNYKKIAFVENRRYRTIIGKQSKIVRADELTDSEYSNANALMFDKFQITIEHGGQFAQEYREPRVLRHLVSLYKGEIPQGQFTKILAVPDFNYLNSFAENKHFTTGVHSLYQKLVRCFLLEKQIRKDNPDLSIIAAGTGAIKIDTFRKLFPENVESLIRSSSIIIRELRNGLTVIIPKIPELIAYHSIPLITNIIEKESSSANYKVICDKLIDIVSPFPYCDIVATGVLMNFGNTKHVELFSELIQELMKVPPHFEEIGKGTKTLMYMEDVGHIQMNFEDDMDEGGFMADFLPFAILSQIAGYPLGLVNNQEYSTYTFHLSLLETIASNENFLRRADARSLKNMKSYEAYDWEGVGHIISGHEGIIEPIVQSIQKCFIIIPEDIEILYNKAFDDNNFPLLWRIYLALRTMLGYSNHDLSNQATKFLERFNTYFNEFMADYCTRNIDNEDERQRIKNRLNELKN